MTNSFIFDARGNRKYLNHKERSDFMSAAVQSPQEVHTFCAVLAYTGARLSEVRALTPMHIDFGAEVIVFESLKKRQKTHYRAVPVPQSLLQLLESVHRIRRAQVGSQSGVNRLWPWSRTTAWVRVKEVMERAGIQGTMASPKGLRHGLGVSAIQSGIPLNIVQKWLGHTHLHTTAIYTNAMGPEERGFAHKLWEGFRGGRVSLPPREVLPVRDAVLAVHNGTAAVFEIVREDTLCPGGQVYHIYRNGQQSPGKYPTLTAAVEAIELEITL